MSERNAHKLGNLGEIIGGVSSISRSDYGYGTPFITYRNVFRNSKIDVCGLELMNVGEKEIARRACKYGDIFFTASSETPDEVAMSSVLLNDVTDLTFNGFSKRLRLHDFNTLLPEFARYYLRSPYFRACMYERMTGDIRYNISNSSIGGVLVYLPCISTQARIADILTAYDDAIKNNNRRIALLEKAAQELYKEWFVRFRFPGHETTKFVNGLPEGWEVRRLNEVSDFRYGTMPNVRQIRESGYPIFSGYRISGYYDSYMFEDEMLVLIARGVGGAGDIKISPPYCYLTNLSIAFLLFDDRIKFYLYERFQQKNLRELDSGAAQSQITIKDLSHYKIIVPPNAVLLQFDKIVRAFYEEKKLLVSKSQNLAKQRDLLLPRLMSGKLEV